MKTWGFRWFAIFGRIGFPPMLKCRHVCRYADRKGSAAILTSIQSAGVTPEVNRRNSLHSGDKACKWGIHPGFETQRRRCARSPKQGYQWPHEKDLCPPKILKKKKESGFESIGMSYVYPFPDHKGIIWVLYHFFLLCDMERTFWQLWNFLRCLQQEFFGDRII